MESIFSIKNKVVVIIGASGDIGYTLSKNFHNENAIVYGLDKSINTSQKKLFKNNFIQYIPLTFVSFPLFLEFGYIFLTIYTLGLYLIFFTIRLCRIK